MKPCYRREGELYVLAHLIKEGYHIQQPCKALISPGNCPPITRATREFLRSSLQVVEDGNFSDECVLSKWHIHIGNNDFEALQRGAWNKDICYLSANPKLGQLGSLPACPLSCYSFTAALSNGHPDCLNYWHTAKVMDTVKFMQSREGQSRQSVEGPYRCSDAASMPTAEVLLYLHDVVGLPWDAKTCDAAAAAGSIDCLSYAHASGCPWHSETCTLAAAGGRLCCLAYAHEHGCEWSTSVILEAARKGHLECLKYAHTRGCPYSVNWLVNCATIGLMGPPAHLTSHACAVTPSSIPCLAYVREAMGCAWDPNGSECKLAFKRGDLELLQYVHSHGGVLCTQFDLLCPDGRWLDPTENSLEFIIGDLWTIIGNPDKRAECLLYVHCYGGCKVKQPEWHSEVGKLAQEMIKARRAAVLLSFHAAGNVCVGGSLVAAAHAAMKRMPSDILQEIMYAAGLQVPE